MPYGQRTIESTGKHTAFYIVAEAPLYTEEYILFRELLCPWCRSGGARYALQRALNAEVC